MSFSILAGVIFLGLIGWWKPLLGDKWLRPIERNACRVARSKASIPFAIGMAAILFRLAVLPVEPVPPPIIHDEFSNLLAADTFAHGRLANPPHPMWAFFDTFHVLQHPTYVTKYPPGEGLVLAFGQLLGNPWLGTLLSLGLMSTAMTWMLQGWIPPHWAMLGGLFVVWQVCLFNPWFDGYLGAPLGACGAALVLGAYPRVLSFSEPRYAIWMGIGLVILALTRPLEGFLFSLPVAIALVLTAHRAMPRVSIRAIFQTLLWPCASVISAGLIWLGYYNWRTSGHPLVFAYSLYHRAYFNYPIFAWQKVPPPLHYSNPQFEAFFNGWNRTAFRLTAAQWAERTWTALQMWWQAYLGRMLTIPFIAFAHVWRDRRMRLPLMEVLVCGLGLISVVWFQPHYAAPMEAAVMVLMMQSMRHLRRFTCSGRPIGMYLSRLVVILAVVWTAALVLHWDHNPPMLWSQKRAQIAERLTAQPGRHLVIVSYAANHNPHQEWVYNAAEIDDSKIVWARAIPGRDLGPLLNYYANRKVWIVYPDKTPPQLEEYFGANPADASEPATGKQKAGEPR